MRIRSAAALLLILSAAASAPATPYWIAWEGDDWPENQGWTRHSVNYFGGPLAERTLDAGWMTIDGRASHGIAEWYGIERPGQLDPDPGEEFVMQWQVRVDEILLTPRDPGVGVFSDDGWVVSLEYTMDSVQSSFESFVAVPFTPYVPHTFELRSPDMRGYDLYLDGSLVRQGEVVHVLRYSNVGWGDAIVGAASQSGWEYFRFGVVPEPASLNTAWMLLLAAGKRVSCRRGAW